VGTKRRAATKGDKARYPLKITKGFQIYRPQEEETVWPMLVWS